MSGISEVMVMVLTIACISGWCLYIDELTKKISRRKKNESFKRRFRSKQV